MEIQDKRVLITGGSSGIGKEIARQLLMRGARLLIAGRRASAVEAAVEELGTAGGIAGIIADITTVEGRASTIEAALASFDGLDILVNNAGGVRAGRLETFDEEDVLAMMKVNLVAPILLTRALLPALRASGDALIINVSSGIAQVGFPFYSVYGAAKAGLSHFGEGLRRELDGEGVRVLTVHPTATETPMMATSGMNPPGGRDTPEAVASETIAAILDGRLDVTRGDADRMALVARNRTDPAGVDAVMRSMKASLETAAHGHLAL
jgi:NAD(P)-dependent dehydrogenase (short-subunit alcohol dehydrogenase family)